MVSFCGNQLTTNVIEWLKADGRGYQTKANGLLRHAMLHFKREKRLGNPTGLRGEARLDNGSEMHGSCRAKMISTITPTAIHSRDRTERHPENPSAETGAT
jgi:hypothetical protein